MAYMAGMLITMCISGACSIPGQIASIDQAYEKAVALCRQTAWNLHRTSQLNKMLAEGEAWLHKDFEAARNLAQASVLNWQLSNEQMQIGQKIAWINAGVLAILMVVYVLLAYFCLFRKRETLQQAFEAVRNIHITPPAPRAT
jgi:hypothetical protein